MYRILEKRTLAPRVNEYVIEAKEVAQHARPGQFIILRVDEKGERIPFTSLLSCFMDTSLVTVVSMYDLTGSLKLALGDAVWRAYFIEGYVFIALVYFISSFIISRYSQWLELRLKGAKARHVVRI